MVRAALFCAVASLLGLCACTDKKATASADLHGAQALYASNDFAGALEAVENKPDEAIAIYRKLVKTEPANALYRAVLAEAEAQRVSVDAGEATLRAGIAAASKSRPMRLQLVGYLARHRDAAAAEAELRSAIAASPDDSAYDLILAAKMAASGRSDEAVALLRAAVTRLGDRSAGAAAQLGLARLLIGKKDIPAATSTLDAILKAQPNNDEALLLRADLLLRNGDATHATADLLAVTGRQPTNTVAFELLAKAFLQLGKTEDAADALKRNADVNPGDLAATIRVVDLYGSLGKVAEARASLGRFVSRNPNDREGRAAEIRLLLVTKDWNAAQGKIDQLVRVSDATGLSTQLTAEMKEARGQNADAASLYKGLMTAEGPQRFDERAARAYVRTALAAGQGGESVASLEALTSDQKGAKGSTVDLLLGTLHAALGETDKALAADESSIRAAPTATEGYVQQAGLLVRTKRFDEALKTIDIGIAAGAPREPMLLAKATLQNGAGDPDAAIATYRAILAGNQSSIVAANNLASLLADRKPLDRGQLTQARDALAKLVSPENAAIADTIAWADYRLGDFASAKTLLAQAGAGHSNDAQMRFHYGAVLIASGDKDGGRIAIKSVLDRTFPGRAEAQDLVNE